MCVFLSSYFGKQFKSLTVSVVRLNKRLFIQELVIVINLLKRFPLRFSSKVTPGTSIFAKLCLWWIPISIYISIYPSSICGFRLENVSVSEFILVSDFWVFQPSSYPVYRIWAISFVVKYAKFDQFNSSLSIRIWPMARLIWPCNVTFRNNG